MTSPYETFALPINICLLLAGLYLIALSGFRYSESRRASRFSRAADQLGFTFHRGRGLAIRGELHGMQVSVVWNRREVLSSGRFDFEGGEAGSGSSGTVALVRFPSLIDPSSLAMAGPIQSAKRKLPGVRISSRSIRLSSYHLSRSVGGIIQSVRRLVDIAQTLTGMEPPPPKEEAPVPIR